MSIWNPRRREWRPLGVVKNVQDSTFNIQITLLPFSLSQALGNFTMECMKLCGAKFENLSSCLSYKMKQYNFLTRNCQVLGTVKKVVVWPAEGVGGQASEVTRYGLVPNQRVKTPSRGFKQAQILTKVLYLCYPFKLCYSNVGFLLIQ